jgi:hypothetical protein
MLKDYRSESAILGLTELLPHHIFPIIKSSADVAKLVELYNSTTTVAERPFCFGVPSLST